MVYGPGGCRFGDFWKPGLLVNVWALIVTVVVIPTSGNSEVMQRMCSPG
jgi:di/tricarboxylate transporter